MFLLSTYLMLFCVDFEPLELQYHGKFFHKFTIKLSRSYIKLLDCSIFYDVKITTIHMVAHLMLGENIS